MAKHEHRKNATSEEKKAERAERMKTNRYALHRTEITRICDERGVDITVGAAMLRDEKGWKFEETGGLDHEIGDFTRYVSSLSPEERREFFCPTVETEE